MSTTNSFLYSLHFCIQGHYQNYNLQLYKATNINRGKIDEVCLVLATEDINTPCMHVGVRSLVSCTTLINQRGVRGLSCCALKRKIHIN